MPAPVRNQCARRIAISTGVLLSGVSACLATPADDADRAAQDSRLGLTNGVPDYGDRAVVGLANATRIFCTGTLVARDVVVTAAHCIDELGPPQVFFGTTPDKGGRFVNVIASRVHPAFRDDVLAYDIGALLLEEEASVGVDPIPLWTGRLDSNAVGTPIRLVGFGADTGASPIKTEGATTIAALDTTSFYHRSDPSQACRGDSGGPALMTSEGTEFVIGIVSGGDRECAEFGKHTRIDVFRDNFLASFPEPTAHFSDHCATDDDCISHRCIDALELGAFRYCSNECANSSDCHEGSVCKVDPTGARLCRVREPGPGAVGSPCDAGASCGSDTCAAEHRSSDGVCALRCFPENEIDCPEGFDCLPDALHADRFACFERSTVPTAAGCATQAPRDGRSSFPLLSFAGALLIRRYRARAGSVAKSLARRRRDPTAGAKQP